MNKKENNQSSHLLRISNLNFKGPFVLALLFFTGITLKYSLKHMEFSPFWLDVISVLANAFIAAAVLDILLSISNERKTITEFSKDVYDAIHKLWANDYFPNRLSRQMEILDSENIAGNSGTTKEELREDFQGYINSLTRYADICTEHLVYIHSFDRHVTLYPSKNSGFVEVHTVTDITYVNLRDTPYYAVHVPQFLRTDGSGESYKVVQMSVDGEDRTKEAEDQLRNAELEPLFEDSLYQSGKKYSVEIPAQQAKRIRTKTIHEMPVSMFFQSKVLALPCIHFSLTANLDVQCIEQLPGNSAVFRWTLFETKAVSPEAIFKKQKPFMEGDNSVLHLTGEYMKPGSGYALTLGFIYDSESRTALNHLRSSSNRAGLHAMMEEAKRWKHQADPKEAPGTAEAHQSAFDKAKTFFECVLLMEPNNQDALKEYGGLYFNSERYVEALSEWKILISLEQKAEYYGLCACAFYCMGQRAEKETYCRLGLLCPDDHDGWHEKLRELLSSGS